VPPIHVPSSMVPHSPAVCYSSGSPYPPAYPSSPVSSPPGGFFLGYDLKQWYTQISPFPPPSSGPEDPHLDGGVPFNPFFSPYFQYQNPFFLLLPPASFKIASFPGHRLLGVDPPHSHIFPTVMRLMLSPAISGPRNTVP